MVVARSLCATHYKRLQRGGELSAPVRVHDPDRGCAVKGCENEHHANGLCDMHNKRRWRDGMEKEGR